MASTEPPSLSSSLPYEEPGIDTLLILSTFILLLTALNSIFNSFLSCGLIAQILIGTLYGAPGANWLVLETQHVVVNLGYLGLILLVYEGGLSTDFRSLKANLWIAAGVAATGVGLPMAVSFVLIKLVGGGASGVSSLQAFAAGAALCSTSLGTTFSVLWESGLVKTRLGVVLSSAAMMDDVVGLVMVQIFSNLGQAFSATTVIRPIFVSIAFAIITPIVAVLIVKPVTLYLNDLRAKTSWPPLETVIRNSNFAFIFHTALLLALVTGSSYAGTSNLFAAYIAGASVSWWDSELPHPSTAQNVSMEKQKAANGVDTSRSPPAASTKEQNADLNITSGDAIFTRFYSQPLERILKPFFFASIGFSVPITQLFSGSIVWRGLVYSALMFMSKMACGIWLVRLPSLFTNSSGKWRFWKVKSKNSSKSVSLDKSVRTNKDTGQAAELKAIPALASPSTRGLIEPDNTEGDDWQMVQDATSTDSHNGVSRSASPIIHKSGSSPGESSQNKTTDVISQTNHHNTKREPSTQDIQSTASTPRSNTLFRPTGDKDPSNPITAPSSPAPLSLHPPLILGTAMTARGEIGFLIASLAESQGVFSAPSSSSSPLSDENSPPQIFLVVTWAIMLCTILGPICVGVLVRRLKKLESGKGGKGRDVLGVWGVTSQ